MRKAKTTKKVNPKDVQKNAIKEVLTTALMNYGTISNGVDYGFTKDTLVLSTADCDIQIKLIAPKANETRYELLEEEE